MNRVVLITGVAGGIGSATAHLFAENGWKIVGVDIAEWHVPPRDSIFIRSDVAEAASWQTISIKLKANCRQISALVNNAALQICKSAIETQPEEWDQVMAINVKSFYLAARHVVPFMRENGGSIVNVSSVHAIATSANIAAYAASKGAILALTRALAIELAPYQVRVNAVLPGAVDTAMLRAGLSRGHLNGVQLEEMMNQLAGKTVMKRVGQPREVAEAIYFLVDSNKSSFITGQSLVVDGGATARLSTE